MNFPDFQSLIFYIEVNLVASYELKRLDSDYFEA